MKYQILAIALAFTTIGSSLAVAEQKNNKKNTPTFKTIVVNDDENTPDTTITDEFKDEATTEETADTNAETTTDSETIAE